MNSPTMTGKELENKVKTIRDDTVDECCVICRKLIYEERQKDFPDFRTLASLVEESLRELKSDSTIIIVPAQPINQ